MKRILLPIDDRKFGEAQIDFLLKHEFSAETEFILFTVIKPLALQDFGYGVARAYFDPIYHEDERLAKMLLEEMEARIRAHAPHAKITRLMEFGSPAMEILREAKERQVDWIIIGSHGRPAIDKFFLGSCSQAVVNRAPCSVSVVRLSEPETNQVVEETKKEVLKA